jgi:hypothetical protein
LLFVPLIVTLIVRPLHKSPAPCGPGKKHRPTARSHSRWLNKSPAAAPSSVSGSRHTAGPAVGPHEDLSGPVWPPPRPGAGRRRPTARNPQTPGPFGWACRLLIFLGHIRAQNQGAEPIPAKSRSRIAHTRVR